MCSVGISDVDHLHFFSQHQCLRIFPVMWSLTICENFIEAGFSAFMKIWLSGKISISPLKLFGPAALLFFSAFSVWCTSLFKMVGCSLFIVLVVDSLSMAEKCPIRETGRLRDWSCTSMFVVLGYLRKNLLWIPFSLLDSIRCQSGLGVIGKHFSNSHVV